MTSTVLQDWITRYRPNSARFMEDVLGMTPQPWQRELFEQYDHRVRGISVRSGHGVGKSTALATIMLHHILCYFPQRTVVTAPTEKQLFDALWADFRSMIAKLPPALQELLDHNKERCELKEARADSYISAKTARIEQPDALQGVHSDYVLLVVDEAAGVPEPVFNAASSSMAGHHAITILAGNPLYTSGFFYDTHHRLSDLWWTRKVHCRESPYSGWPRYGEEVAARHGQHSNEYLVRVEGEFPHAENNSIIPRDLVVAALHRDVQPRKGAPVIWGLDTAFQGDDRTALAKRQENVLLEPVKFWTKLDATEIAGRVQQEFRTTPDWLRPVQINVDSIHLGAPVVYALQHLNLPARGINVSEVPALRHADRFSNQRAELWFKAAEWFAKRDSSIPASYERPEDGHDLIRELTTPVYDVDGRRSNKMRVQDKREIKKSLGFSPDLAEAFILTFATDAAALRDGASPTLTGKISAPMKGLT